MSDDSRIEGLDPIAAAGPPGSMKRTLAAGVGWMTALQLVSKVMELGFIAVLARLLSPADFGVIAGATIFIQFTAMLVEIGISSTLVQLPDLSRDDVRAAGTLVFINSLIYFALTQALAPLAGEFMQIEAVTPVLRVLAFVFIIQAVGVVSESLLVRRLDVRRVMFALLAARAIGTGGLGLFLAWNGWGYWALVIATLAETAIKAVWLVLVVRPPLKPLLTRALASRLLRRGTGFSAAKLINFVALRADKALVGRTMDAAALGYYSRAYNLMSVPADLYGRIAERLIFPAMAQMQNDPVRLRSAFLRGLELTALIGMPMSALLALLAPEVIEVVLGSGWAPVIIPFAVLSTASYFRLGAKVSGSLQRAKGATGAMITNQIVYVAMVVGGCLLAYPHGLTAVAAAVSLGVGVFYLVVNYNACRIAGVTIGSFMRSHAHGALLALAATVVVIPVLLPLRAHHVPPFAILLVAGAMLGVLGAILVWTRPQWLLGAFGTELAGDARGLLDRRLSRFAHGRRPAS